MRGALDAILEDRVPDAFLEKLDPKILETLPEGITWNEVIALRVVMAAATADRPADVVQAANLILGTQSELVEEPAKLPPPILASTEEQREECARELGVTLEKRTLN